MSLWTRAIHAESVNFLEDFACHGQVASTPAAATIEFGVCQIPLGQWLQAENFHATRRGL